jgi:hypothetical protein
MKKLKKILSYPIKKTFKYDLVLLITVRSIFILFLLFSFAWISEYFFNAFFEMIKPFIYVLKDTLYMIIGLLPLGYFISKYKFCVTTLISFYMIIFLRVFWMINTHLISIPNYKEINIALIIFALVIIIYDRIISNRSK